VNEAFKQGRQIKSLPDFALVMILAEPMSSRVSFASRITMGTPRRLQIGCSKLSFFRAEKKILFT
jgi:hypothetical protein